jgi:tRNA 2-thiouridine synthesizing protein D
MKFTIIVNQAPFQSQSSDSACHFARALLQQGHELCQVFFYLEGVWNAVANAEPPQDDRDVISNWSTLAIENNLDLIVCSTAAKRRGVGVGKELAPEFRLDTLGRLSDAISNSDRVISFG